MSHEFEHTDKMIYAGERPWHGMGTRLPRQCTPREAVTSAELDWSVSSLPVVGDEDHEKLVRSDTNTTLEIVKSGYVPLQNIELAEFIENVLEDDFSRVETAGSFRGGRRVWFLLSQGLRDVGGVDPVHIYSLFGNGHDGTLDIRILPTTIRVVCSNTFTFAERSSTLGLSIPHTGVHADLICQAREALANTEGLHEQFIQLANLLARRPVDRKWLRAFFARVYMSAVATPRERQALAAPSSRSSNMTSEETDRARARMDSTMNTWMANFNDADGGRLAPSIRGTAWHAFNSVTQHLDHQFDHSDDRAESNLMGSVAGMKTIAFKLAFQSLDEWEPLFKGSVCTIRRSTRPQELALA